MKITLSKKQWEDVGKKTGWTNDFPPQEWISMHTDPSKSKTWVDHTHYLMEQLGNKIKDMGYNTLADLADDYHNKYLPPEIEKIVMELIDEHKNQINVLKTFVER